ncbi:MAG TPA: biopolymer transporter ExbD [Candidatus Xenobia bacterium]|nr:biopolymer transporter ExbD [Candidatus Xenobia bacterium]
MGITVAKGKGPMCEPNIVPFIDILLVLIIIFMVITPLTPKGLEALVPQPPPPDAPDTPADPSRVIVIQLECADGGCNRVALKINQKDVTWETLGPELTTIFKERAERVAFIKASDNMEFAQVARAIDIAKLSGVDKVGLITSKVEMGE